LARAIDRVLRDAKLAAALAAAGHAVYQQRYTEGAVVQQCLDFYRQISA
jgi:hypothetical protein